MSTRQELALEIVCDLIESVIIGKARVIGGMLVGGVVIVTLNNGYCADGYELRELSRLLEWREVMACPGAVSISPTQSNSVSVMSPRIAPPYINPRLPVT